MIFLKADALTCDSSGNTVGWISNYKIQASPQFALVLKEIASSAMLP